MPYVSIFKVNYAIQCCHHMAEEKGGLWGFFRMEGLIIRR